MKHIRTKLGLSQSELANLLGMPRGTISVYELGMRNLNSSQLAIVSQIELLLVDEPPIAATEAINIKASQASAALRKKMERRLENVSFECIRLKRKLEALQSKYEKNQRLWCLIASLRVKAQKGTELMAYLDLLEIKCLEKSEDYGLDKQTEVAFNINLLEYEQSKLIEMVGG